MRRSARLVALATIVVLAVPLAGCTARQAPVARTVGKVLSVGGVLGLVGSALGARFTGHGQELLIGFSVISGVGIGTYAAGDLSQPDIVYKQETLPQRHHRWAKILTERAAGAARDGRCARVRRLEARVHRYDAAVHDVIFMRDPEILRCLGQPAPESGLFPSEQPGPPDPTPVVRPDPTPIVPPLVPAP